MPMETKKSKSSYILLRQTKFQEKFVRRDKEIHIIVIKGSIEQENTKVINIYAPR